MERTHRAEHVWRVRHASGGAVNTLDELRRALFTLRELEDHHHAPFFAPKYERDIHDPITMHDMEQAVDEVYRARLRGKRVLVYGDYDADGISSTAIMMDVLEAIGVSAMPYLPHRMHDGYGLKRDVLEHALEDFDLLITVDCGVSNADEIAWLRKQGKRVIVVDHHELPETLPDAHAILHPRHPQGSYGWHGLSGAGVSWKFAQALLRHTDSGHAHDADREKWLLDLALLGTVGDIMPLLGENRAIVRFGMEVLRITRRPGLRALSDAAGFTSGDVTVEDLAFRLIPLINAAGRIDHPQQALDVLLASDEARAQAAVEQLQRLNKQRQTVTQKIMNEAMDRIDTQAPILFAADTSWHAGVVGLVAGKIASKFARPAIIVGGNGEHGVGSARSVEGVNILEALQSSQEHMMKLGGHEKAAGFSVDPDKVGDLQESLYAYAHELDEIVRDEAPVCADMELNARLIDWDTLSLIDRFEPFGEANPKPTFYIRGLSVLDARTVGKEGKHLKVRFGLPQGEVDGIGFGIGDCVEDAKGDVDVVGCIEKNTYRGTARLQISIKAIAPTRSVSIDFGS